eukprot:4125704-Prymnesium_polylepis.2
METESPITSTFGRVDEGGSPGPILQHSVSFIGSPSPQPAETLARLPTGTRQPNVLGEYGDAQHAIEAGQYEEELPQRRIGAATRGEGHCGDVDARKANQSMRSSSPPNSSPFDRRESLSSMGRLGFSDNVSGHASSSKAAQDAVRRTAQRPACWPST